MYTIATNLGSCFYNGLQKIINAEATYVNARQQSARDNLPKGVVNVAESVSYAVKGVTAAVVLGYGAPLPVTALVVLNLFPYNTFSYIASKVKWVGDKISKLLGYDEQEDDDLFGRTKITGSNGIDITSYLPSIKTLETAQYIAANGLTLYQNLLPVNWLKIMAIEAVEQPLRWYNTGKLPDYYVNNAIADWIWTVSGISGELLQSYKMLNNSFTGQDQLTQRNYNVKDIGLPLNKIKNLLPYSNLIKVSNVEMTIGLTILSATISHNRIIGAQLILPLLFYQSTVSASTVMAQHMQTLALFQTSNYTIEDQKNPSLTTLLNGNFVAVWQSYNQYNSTSGWDVYGQIFSNTGTKISTEFLVNTYTYSDQCIPVVAYKLDGGFVVSWQSYGQDGSGWGIYGQIFSKTGVKAGQEFLVNTITDGDQTDPMVAPIYATKGLVFIYRDYRIIPNAWYYQPSLGGEMFLSSNIKQFDFEIVDWGVSAAWSYKPTVAVFSDSTFLVVWTFGQLDAGYYDSIQGQLFSITTNALSSGFTVNQNTFGATGPTPPLAPVAILPNDNFVVVWQSNNIDGSGYGISGRIFLKNSSAITSEFQVNTYTHDDQLHPAIITLPSGNFVVTWYSDDQSLIYGQIFSGVGSTIGNKLGTEFSVKTDTTTYQSYPAIIGLLNNDFVVTFDSYKGTDLSGLGVYGKLMRISNSYSLTTTPTPTPSESDTNTDTPTPSSTDTNTDIITTSPTPSTTDTTTVSPTPTALVRKYTKTLTATSTDTNTETASQTSSTTDTNTDTAIVSPTPTSTDTNTDTMTVFHSPNQTNIIDFTKLFGRTNISDIVIRFPKSFTGSGMKLVPKELGPHNYGQPLEPYEIASSRLSLIDLGNSSTGLNYNATYRQFWAAEGRLKWTYVITDGWVGMYSATLGVNGSIYVAGDKLYSISADGALQWSYKQSLNLSGYFGFTSPAIAPDGSIYVGGATWGNVFLYSLNPNGTLRWNRSIDTPTFPFVYSSPAIGIDGNIYICPSGIYSFNANGILQWSYTETNGWGSSPAIGIDGGIYVGAGGLYSFNADGTLRWRYLMDNYYNGILSPSIGIDGNIYISSGYNNLSSINVNGTLQWSYPTGGEIEAAPAIGVDGSIYIGSDGGTLYSFNTNGALRWQYTSGWVWSSATIGVDGSIYVVSTNIYCFDTNGTLRWSYPVSTYDTSPVIGVDGSIYVTDFYDNTLYALSIKVLGQAPWPMFQQNLQRTGRIPDGINYTRYDLRYWSLTGFASVENGNWCLEIEDVSGVPVNQNGNIKIVCINQINSTNTDTTTVSPTPSPTSTHTATVTASSSITSSNTNTDITTASTTPTPTSTPTPSPSNTLTESSTSTVTHSNIPNVNTQPKVSILLSINELFSNSNGILMLSATLSGGEMLPSWLSITFTPKLFSSYMSVNSNSIKVIGNTAYIADDYGLKIIDLSNLLEPKLIGSYVTTGVASSLTVIEDIVYLATNMAGLQIINIDNPSSPILINNYPTVDANNVFVINNNVLVAGTTGLYIFNKGNNQLLGNYLTSNPVKSLYVQDTTAFIATSVGGLQIVDISDVTRPNLISSYTATQFVNSITVANNMVLIADFNLGLQIIDINNLNKPKLLGQYNALEAARSVTLSGSMVFIIDNSGLQVIDISSASKPSLLGNYNPSELSTKRFSNKNHRISNAILQGFSKRYLRGASRNAMGAENTNQTSNLLSYATIINTSTMAVGRGGLQVIDCTKWTISGTPPNNTNISTYNLSLTATDSFGKNFTRSLQLNIEPLVLTKTVSPTITPTVSHTSTGTVTTSLTTPHVDTIMDNTTPNQVPSSPPSSSSGTKSAESNNGLYIGAAIGGSIAGIAATSALILYCYKKRQKNKTRILPNQEPNAEVLISEETITSPDVTATRNTNTMLFSTTLRRTAQTYAPTTTERPPSNPVPFSLSAPSTLDGGELYPHYDEAESRNHSPSSRQFLVRQVP